ncbi:hypothetical protein DQ04_06811010 [Trypanosoma grayi]|uniref:hypothetical protein n=1 Tax=Trypanosoma grayi TaxID=71804 RepID=UPI0004F3F0CF|nr:hypothetical protein DQ04_06811010 [Trypanosoma grayi]KEG08608.1 hypothetical protein DQ04_06811010 [Trypanosoma grayi]
MEWDLWDCYEAQDTSKLRRPARIVSADALLPLPEGVLPSRVTLKGMRGMVQHYWKALLTEQQRTSLSRRPAVTRTTLFPVDKVAALYVLRHHPEYCTRVRGCGIADVCVQQQLCPAGGRRRPSTAADEEVGGDDAQVTEQACEYMPTLAIMHKCGSVTAFAYEDCYNPVTGTLNRPQVVESDEGAVDTAWCPSPPSRKRSLSP